MSIWGTARASLASSVVRHLGETITLLAVAPSTATVAVPGVLVRPEDRVRIGNSDYVISEGTLTLRAADTPAWFGRGTRVSNEAGETFKVVQARDNGEGLTEATLSRVS